MSHERQTIYGDYTIYVDCCYHCPWFEEKTTFESIVDERYNIKEQRCGRLDIKLMNPMIIPIECDLPPRYKT